VTFLIVESDFKATNTPSMPTIYPNTSNQNCEIAFLLNIVERSRNYIFEDDTPSTALKTRVVSYALGALRYLLKALS
jgi:hypothetical protein